MRRRLIGLMIGVIVLACGGGAYAWVIDNWWPDGDDVVFDDVFMPVNPWSAPAQQQMSEYNEIDVTNNSHPFQINTSPELSFGSGDGDNTIGFLGEASLNSEYGLSYAMALAWTQCFSSTRLVECDVMLDPTLPWNLGPDNSNWFQSTVLHELGHVRGLNHYNGFHSMQNSAQSKYLRDESLYMDDKDAIRQHATYVPEFDLVMYNKWHDGAAPQWMTMSPTTLREFEQIDFSGITVENRGSEAFTSPVRFGTYLSGDDAISTGDQLLNTGSFDEFGVFTFSTFDWSATIPTVNDCGTMYVGGIIDDDGAFAERYEGNNAVTFTNGVAFTGTSYTPTPLSILLAKDSHEPNDSLAAASPISLPFASASVNIDEDLQEDWYSFDLSCGLRVDADVTFSHAAGDIDLELRSSGNAVVGSSASGTDDESITVDLPAGSYAARVYGDGAGSCNRYEMAVSATDVTPPEVTAPAPVTLECNSPGGIPGSDPEIQAWIASATAEDECEGPIANIMNDAPGFFASACPPGNPTTVNFSASDSGGNVGGDSSTVTVVDSMAPSVQCAVAKDRLWPPNHRMADVGLTYSSMDICDANPLTFDVSVLSDEHPATASGAGGAIHCEDAIIGPGGEVQLRAERSGGGDGRVYTIVVSATDSCGNVGICEVNVTVPHNMGHAAMDSGGGYDPTVCDGPAPLSQDGSQGRRTLPTKRAPGGRRASGR
jgi:hypothetical protein